MKTRHLVAAAALLAASAAQAYDFKPLDHLNQSDFLLFSKDVSAAMSYRPIEPVEGLGLLGFDVGVNVSGTQLQSIKVLENAAGTSNVPNTLPTASVRVSKGLPFDLNVGATYTVVPATSVKSMSLTGSWAVISGGIFTPAVGVRAAYSKVSGITGVDMSSAGLDVSISKGFGPLTPYAGVGSVRTKSTPNGSSTLTSESFSQGRMFVGVNANLLLFDLAAEADKTGDNQTYSVKLGFRF